MTDIFKVGKSSVRIIEGDITEMATDAIVNAANRSLMGGGGVDGAIHSKGGPTILEECKTIRATRYPDGLPTGQAVITGAGNLKAKHVIHTVGPIWYGGKRGEAELLKQCYLNSLRLSVEARLRSIAFPSISTGTYGYPIEQASHIALRATKEFLKNADDIDEVIFVLFSTHDLRVYLSASAEIFGFT